MQPPWGGRISPEPPAKQTNSQLLNWAVYGALITADGDCSHEIKTLTPWKESYDQPR